MMTRDNSVTQLQVDMYSKKKARSRNIDLIKVIAMIFVMGLHSRGYFLEYPTYDFGYYLIHSICGLAIPLFFMVSGHLLLGRNENADYFYSFKKIYAIVRFVLIITTLYYCVYAVMKGFFNLKELAFITFGSFLQYGTFGVFWYLGAMICIYLVYPIINKLYNNLTKQFLIGVGVLSCICCSTFIISQLSQIGGGELEEGICQTLRIWNWILYFSLGGLLKKYHKNGSWTMVAVSAVLYLAMKYLSTKLHGHISPEYSFGSIVTQVYACSVFLVLMKLKLPANFYKSIDCVSNLFLPVYAFHMLVISHTKFIVAVLKPLSGIAAPLMYWIVVAIITISFSYIVMKLPYANRIFKI